MIDDMGFPLMIRDMPIPESRTRAGALSKADELLQEAYYRFYRAGKQYESQSHRRNSLFQIATNVLRDAARRGRRWGEVPLADKASPAPRPARQVAMRTDVARAIQQLA